MFCSNCKKNVNNNEDFCSNCGFEITKTEQVNSTNFQSNDSNISALKQATQKTSNLENNFLKIKKFLFSHKKESIIVLGLIIMTVILLVLFSNFYGFKKLSWDVNYEHYNYKYISPVDIKLGVIYDDWDKINEIKFSSTCGEIKSNGLEVKWDLSDAIGNCKITASYRKRKISKEYIIINPDTFNYDLSLDYEIDFDSDEDLDFDGLTNKEEKAKGTNPVLSDTDMDELDDNYEIYTSKTNPNKVDSDNDGLNDYDELELGFNPLIADSKGDGIKDGERTSTYNYLLNNLRIFITGKGNIASTTAKVNPNVEVSSRKGMINNLYTFNTRGTIDKAIITIPYTDEDLLKYQLIEENLSLYYYNEKNMKYEKVQSAVDTENNTITATLNHFSSYVIGDSSKIEETVVNQVLFLLDNSWSMYSSEQYKKITGVNFSTRLEGNDKDGLRFSLTKELIDKMALENFKVGISEFRGDYKNVAEIGTSKDILSQKLSAMNGKFVTISEGTRIANALKSGIKQFSEETNSKYIVILTDGQDSTLKSKANEILQLAIDNNVKICSIGFGGATNNPALSNISNGSGCKFYSSQNVEGLEELFKNVEVELNNGLVDVNNDGEMDGVLIADSGFVPSTNGFSFSNFGSSLSEGGNCYGMSTFAQLYYKGKLPLIFESKKVDDLTSLAYNLNDTYFEKYGNLYDYKLATNALKYKFGFGMFGEETPASVRDIIDKKALFSDTYRKKIVETGIYGIKEKEISSTQKKDYEMYEYVVLDMEKIQNGDVMVNDDRQMFNAIYAAHIKQHTTTNFSSGSNITLELRKFLNTESVSYTGHQAFINILIARLNDKDAPVITSIFDALGIHAVNAISLVQKSDDPNYYYIGIYDNNYPGKKRYVDLKCTNNNCATVANGYYTGSNEPIRISPSLEDDLKYYNN